MFNNSKAPGWFGEFGGAFVAETLAAPVEEVAQAYSEAKADPEFQATLSLYLRNYVGRPTPLTYAQRLSEILGGAKIYLKREDLTHTGAHKINNTLGQALLAKRMGKSRLIAETGAGQHGVATATVASLLGLECCVYMGQRDMERQSLNVFRMKLLGAEVKGVKSGSQTLKDAINEAMRDWVTNIDDSYYLLGSVLGPHPYPTMVRDFQTIIGKEARRQIIEQEQRLPDYLVACVGGGSNAIGLFHDFLEESSVKLMGVEAGGRGIETGQHASRFEAGDAGIFHGTKSLFLQNHEGQIQQTHSISAGLDYAGIGPEHAYLKSIGRAQYGFALDYQAIDAFKLLSKYEGILPALESAHAVAEAVKLAPTLSEDQIILVNLSGRGDKDVMSMQSLEGGK